jgi:hypothetical protein
MHAKIIDANGECFDLGDIEITAETTLNALAGGRDISMPAVLVYGDSGSPNFTDTPAPPHDGRLFRPDESDRFPASTFPPSSIVTVKSLLNAMSGGMASQPLDVDRMIADHLRSTSKVERWIRLPEPAKGWPDPNRRGARKTRRGRLP